MYIWTSGLLIKQARQVVHEIPKALGLVEVKVQREESAAQLSGQPGKKAASGNYFHPLIFDFHPPVK